jgi:hypothetical protein
VKKPGKIKAEGTGVFPQPTVEVHAVLYSPLTDVSEDHPFFRLIGRVSAEWAQFEHTLDLVIWILVGASDPLMACVTAQVMGAQPRCNAIIALIKQRGLSDRLRKECTSLIKDAHGPQTARNRIAVC